MLSALRYITGYGPSDAAGGTGGFGSTDLAGTSYTHGYSNGYDQVTVVDDEDDVLSAVKSGSMNALRFLLSDGADAKITDEVGRTALHVAVRKGRVDMISVLVGGGCEVNAKDKHGYTPLHLAAASGNAAIAWKLLELGAEVEATDCVRRDCLPGSSIPDCHTPILHAWPNSGESYRAVTLAGGQDTNARRLLRVLRPGSASKAARSAAHSHQQEA
mmetsp:Transcript_18932/g.47819  ORF Transcript_18932/g.47819 Transcript_18932/m.47819 type:complete len:216 (-) Transcript_18932:413-1060(-)